MAGSYVCRRCGARYDVQVKDASLLGRPDDAEWLGCPRCGRRLPAWRAYARAWRGAAGGHLLLLARVGLALTLLVALFLASFMGARVAAVLSLGLAAAIVVGFGRILVGDRVHAVYDRLQAVSRFDADEPQVVGFPCAVCTKKIVFQADGETCVCEKPVHRRCMPLHGCAERAEAPRL
jgi:hypothetical protein